MTAILNPCSRLRLSRTMTDFEPERGETQLCRLKTKPSRPRLLWTFRHPASSDVTCMPGGLPDPALARGAPTAAAATRHSADVRVLFNAPEDRTTYYTGHTGTVPGETQAVGPRCTLFLECNMDGRDDAPPPPLPPPDDDDAAVSVDARRRVRDGGSMRQSTEIESIEGQGIHVRARPCTVPVACLHLAPFSPIHSAGRDTASDVTVTSCCGVTRRLEQLCATPISGGSCTMVVTGRPGSQRDQPNDRLYARLGCMTTVERGLLASRTWMETCFVG